MRDAVTNATFSITTIVAIAISLLASLPAGAQEQETPAQVLFTNVNVWDGTSDGSQTGMNVLVDGKLIQQVPCDRMTLRV